MPVHSEPPWVTTPDKGLAQRSDAPHLAPRGRLILRISLALLVASLTIGLVGAFVGVDTSSYWYDELFTSWVTGGGGGLAGLGQRIATDLHPPLYYLAASAVTAIFGSGDAVLRGFSAVCAVAAILAFILGVRQDFSLPSRIFAGALAVSSRFWFFQSQEARSYAFALLLTTGLMAICVRIGRATRDGEAASTGLVAGLFVASLSASGTHFYAMFVTLAILAVTAVCVPKYARLMLALGGLIVVLAYAYLCLVIRRYSAYHSDHTWVSGRLAWYPAQFHYAFTYSFGLFASAALAVCVFRIAAAPGRVGGWRAPGPWLRAVAASPSRWRVMGDWVRSLGVARALGLFGPLLVLAEGVSSSVLLSPNFVGKSYLLCSPFIWVLAAWIYERGVVAAADRWRPLAALGVALCVLGAAGIVAWRFVPFREPWRDVSRTMETVGDCRGADVIMLLNEDPRLTRPHFDGDMARVMASHYDRLGVRVITVLVSDALAGRLPPAAVALLRGGVRTPRCPVVADWIHIMNSAQVEDVRRSLERARDGMSSPLDISVRRIAIPTPDLANRPGPVLTAVVFLLAPRK